MLLIYECIKVHFVGKFPELKDTQDVEENDSEESQGLFNTEDSEGLHSEDEEMVPKRRERVRSLPV